MVTVTQTITTTVQQGGAGYLQQFICNLTYGYEVRPGQANKLKVRPEVFWLPRNTQPGVHLVINNQFIEVIEKLNNPK